MVDILQEVYALWSGEAFIAQLGLMMALHASTGQPALFRHCAGAWFVTSTAALVALVRGNSDQPDLHLLAEMIHCYVLAESLVYFEWIAIKADWVKGI